MKITEYFDPDNMNHIKAYAHMQNTGFWPEEFIPKDTEFPVCWNMIINGKIADRWVKYKLEGK